METDEYTCSGTGDGSCKRIGGKLSKKSYKETCKFTINSLLSKPDRPHKTPAPHVNCKITNKKAHTVFSFNDSPEKLIKMKSPHMLTAEVKKLYSPPTLENYRYLTVSTKEGLVNKEAKYSRSSPGTTCSTYRPATPATISTTYRPTTAQLLYQRQLSKQEHRGLGKDNVSECTFDSDNDPFRFTPTKKYSNGLHSPPYKQQPIYAPELDKFAYHSPERYETESDTLLSEYQVDCQKMELSGVSSSTKDAMIPDDLSADVKSAGAGSPPSECLLPESGENNKPSETVKLGDTAKLSKTVKANEADLNVNEAAFEVMFKSAEVSCPSTSQTADTLTPVANTTRLIDNSTSEQHVPLIQSSDSCVKSEVVKTNLTTTENPATEEQPSSKLYRGKLSFFKQAISQEIETLQEVEKKNSESPKSHPISGVLVSHRELLSNKDELVHKEHSPDKYPPKEQKQLPTNVVRKVIKRPTVVKPTVVKPTHSPSAPSTLKQSPFTKPPSSPAAVRKTHSKIVHSINANPIPLAKQGDITNGHRTKVNVVKIEKHHVSPVSQKVTSKDMSVFKFSSDKHSMITQTFGDPISYSPSLLKTHKSKKRKLSSDSPKMEGASKAKKDLKNHVQHTNIICSDESTNVSDSPNVRNNKCRSTQGPRPVLATSCSPTKTRKISGNGTKELLQKKLLSQAHVSTETHLSHATTEPHVKQEVTPKTHHETSIKTENLDAGSIVCKKEATIHETKEDAAVKTIGLPTPPCYTSLHLPTPPMSLLTDPSAFLNIEACSDGGATVVRLDIDQFDEMSADQQNLVVDYFFETTFGETNGVADHVMGIISNGSKFLPNVLNYIVETSPGLKIKHQVLGKKDVLSCTVQEYCEKIFRNNSRYVYHEGGLLQTSLVGTKSEESGGFFSELLDLMELSPFFEATLPWGSLARYEGLDPSVSNDGPIFWVRPGEQFLQSTSGSRNHKGYRLLKNRETLVPDRTTPHADHSWEDGKTIATTAAAAFIQQVTLPDITPNITHNITLKDVIAFDAANFYQLAEELQLDLYEPPMTQCEVWIEDAKLNQLRAQNIKYARIKLKADDMYFIPRNVIHQFKTVAACLSVAWHVRLKQYYED